MTSRIVPATETRTVRVEFSISGIGRSSWVGVGGEVFGDLLGGLAPSASGRRRARGVGLGGGGVGAEPGQDRVELLAGFLAERGAFLGGLAADLGELGAQLLGGAAVVGGAALGGGLIGLGPGQSGSGVLRQGYEITDYRPC